MNQSAVLEQTLHPLLWNSGYMSESQTYSEGRADLGNLLSPQSSVRGLLRAGVARHISAVAAAGWGPAGSRVWGCARTDVLILFLPFLNSSLVLFLHLLFQLVPK